MQRFKNILLVLQDTHLSGPSAQRAVELARLNQAKLTIIDVLSINPWGRSLHSFSEKIEKMRSDMIAARRQEIEEMLYGYLKDVDAEIEVLAGKPFLEIIRYVQKHQCDLVIKSAEREKLFQSILLGSTDLKLLRKCPCAVWIVKPDDRVKSKKILAAIDLESFNDETERDQLNRQIIEIASSLGCRESAELHLVNAYVIFDGSKLAKKLSRHFEEDASVWVEEQKANVEEVQLAFRQSFAEYVEKNKLNELEYHYRFIKGQAEDVIVDLVKSEGMDLIVMGTVGRSDLAGFFVGNTSEAVLSQINCSVLAVKPPGFTSPVTVEHG